MSPGKVLAVMLLAMPAGLAMAAPAKVAVADFDYQDSSGEQRDQAAAHQTRLSAMKADIIDIVGKSSKATAAPLQCGEKTCSVDGLDADQIVKSARAENAQFVVFGGVHKISTLIQWGQIEIMDVSSGKAVLSRTVTFRGDDEAAWQHASDYVGQMVLSAVQ